MWFSNGGNNVNAWSTRMCARSVGILLSVTCLRGTIITMATFDPKTGHTSILVRPALITLHGLAIFTAWSLQFLSRAIKFYYKSSEQFFPHFVFWMVIIWFIYIYCASFRKVNILLSGKLIKLRQKVKDTRANWYKWHFCKEHKRILVSTFHWRAMEIISTRWL